MTREKKRRKDQFNWKRFSQYDVWALSNAAVKYDNKSRRRKDKMNCLQLLLDIDEENLDWVFKWHRLVDYYY